MPEFSFLQNNTKEQRENIEKTAKKSQRFAVLSRAEPSES